MSMWRKALFFVFLSVSNFMWSHAIVFVHIGDNLPHHLDTTCSQARLFNEETPIYIVANEVAIERASKNLKKSNPIFVSCESLPISPPHKRFQNNNKHEMDANGLFKYSLERFFYLEEFIREYNMM